MAISGSSQILIETGAISISLITIKHETIAPNEPLDFTRARTADGSVVYDVSETVKKSWSFRNEVPLTQQQENDLSDLYNRKKEMTLKENWLEGGTTHIVFMESKQPELGAPKGALKFDFIFQEV